ncbi:efflux RND transporter periplasmic adaptor subunit [Arhodomonas aquaeolei]|uniref:efflux RND transporter periplasmic adaptor subunit n=1 Tax=Arhodomonas aquaeolei TaxID=2369 RepID=UPI00216831E2|nr:efflux RND transporter periplasmic adaptor subunit [Arhodomonas aquaeolei]MCS4504193.1 efflux RND transporter periplasmic adaptor subunit [Arhodomonas aquaeolei]
MRNAYNSRSLSAVIVLSAALAGLAGGPAVAQQSKRPPPEVGVVELHMQPVEQVTRLPGRTSAYRVAEVRPQVTGILQKRDFRAGSQVSAGDTLYEIDPRRYRAAVHEAEASLAEARATLDSARRKAERYSDLVKKNHVSQQDYDDVQAAYQEQKARVASAKAALESARIDLAYTSIDAPIDGRISQSYVTEGALVTANQETALARITQLDPIYVDIQRSTTEMIRLRRAFHRGDLEKAEPGKARVELLLDDGTEYGHPGKLEFTGVTVDQGTGTVTLRAVFPNPDHELMPGMFVRARLSSGTKQDTLLVPQQGITHNRQGEATALVVNGEGKAEQRSVKVGRALGSFWVVEDGLSAGDRVIVSGLQKARPGQAVKAVAAEIPNRPGETDNG